MLVLKGNDDQTQYFWELSQGEYVLGRHEDADLIIKDSTISKHHALIEISVNNELIHIIDLNSFNGTAVNDKQITDRVALVAGDKITFGKVELELAEVSDIYDIQEEDISTQDREKFLKHTIELQVSDILQQDITDNVQDSNLISSLSLMAKMLTGPYSKRIMLDKSLKLISKNIIAERLVVLLKTDAEDELKLAAGLGNNCQDQEDLNLSRTIIKNILDNNKALVINDIRKDDRFAKQQSVIKSDLTTAMAVPLFDEGRVLGILYADSSNPLVSYENEHLAILAMFANIITARLLNDILLEEREQKRMIEAELAYAGKIQKRLLTDEIPQINGYKLDVYLDQCRDVGGDFYEITELPDGRFVIMIADVSGKGMGASLLMSNALAAFRILFKSHRFDLVYAVENVSSELCKYSERSAFITCFIGILDIKSHTLHFVNAGHNPPLLVTSEGKLEFLKATGLMMGAFDDYKYQSSTFELNRGDLLFAFTDGLCEAQNGTEMYSDERVEQKVTEWQKLKPDQIIANFKQDVNDFIGDYPMADDITIIALKRV